MTHTTKGLGLLVVFIIPFITSRPQANSGFAVGQDLLGGDFDDYIGNYLEEKRSQHIGGKPDRLGSPKFNFFNKVKRHGMLGLDKGLPKAKPIPGFAVEDLTKVSNPGLMRAGQSNVGVGGRMNFGSFFKRSGQKNKNKNEDEKMKITPKRSVPNQAAYQFADYLLNGMERQAIFDEIMANADRFY